MLDKIDIPFPQFWLYFVLSSSSRFSNCPSQKQPDSSNVNSEPSRLAFRNLSCSDGTSSSKTSKQRISKDSRGGTSSGFVVVEIPSKLQCHKSDGQEASRSYWQKRSTSLGIISEKAYQRLVFMLGADIGKAEVAVGVSSYWTENSPNGSFRTEWLPTLHQAFTIQNPRFSFWMESKISWRRASWWLVFGIRKRNS